MESSEIFIPKSDFGKAFSLWEEKHPNIKHPNTTFIESIGLRYLNSTKTMGLRFFIEDQHKYFLAKIQYGL